MTATLSATDGRLFFQLSDGGQFEIFARGATELHAQYGSITVRLVEADGKVTALKRSDAVEFQRLD